MDRVAILGLGLMGGSLGLALKAKGFGGTVACYARRAETRHEALERGIADEVCASPAEAAEGADLLVACVPILRIPDLVREAVSGLKKGAVVTDVGSTKAWLANAVSPILEGSGAAFIGSHPVAGSEQQGLDAATATLYEDALTVVTPVEGDRDEDVQRVSDLWRLVGSAVRCMAPDAHDVTMARTSHLPHLVAALLASTVGRGDSVDDVAPFCGTGFRDTTRIAEGSPDVWRDIAESNRASVLAELDAFQEELTGLRAVLESSDFEGVHAWLSSCRDRRRALTRRPSP